MQSKVVNIPVVIEKLNPSDEKYRVVELTVFNKGVVEKGHVLFSVETSKAIFEIEAPSGGYFFHNLTLDSFVEPNEEVGIISNDLNFNFVPTNLVSKSSNRVQEQIVTMPASKLISKNSIDIQVFSHLDVVKEVDVKDYLKTVKTDVPILNEDCLKNDLILIGGTGTATMLIDAIRSTNSFKIHGILDNNLRKNTDVMGVRVLGGDELLDSLYSRGYRNLVISFTSLGSLQDRMSRCIELQNRGFLFPNIFHRSSSVEPTSQFGQGNIILANALVGSSVTMGDFNFVNTSAVISHECRVLSNNHFAPGSILAGRLHIGNNNLFGMGSTVYHDLSIGNNNVLYNGVNLFKNLKDNEKLSE